MKPAAAAVAGWLASSLLGFAAEPWTLQRALTEGLAQNPDARLAQHRIAAVRAD
ncbi:MAG: hypothetical protein U1G07_21900 [Verrucomicrobiota bacterium]